MTTLLGSRCVLVSAGLLGVADAQEWTAESIERRDTRLVCRRHDGVQQVAIDYGPHSWGEFYQRLIDEADEPQIFRLGKGRWTTLFAGVPVTIGSTRIERGVWHLAVEKAAEGWRLAVFDAKKNAIQKRGAQRTGSFQPELRCALSYSASDEVKERLEIELMKQEAIGRGRLELRLGPHRVAADVQMHLELEPPPGFPVFALPVGPNVERLASGARFERIWVGAGERPTRADTVHLEYVLWRADGTELDWTIRRAPRRAPMRKLMPEWQEALVRMKCGDRARLQTNDGMVVWLELVDIVPR